DWVYFNEQGFFIFDCIIILFGNGFTKTDIAIMTNCQRFQITVYLVRLIDRALGYNPGNPMEFYRFRSDTETMVQRELEEAGLPRQGVFTVSNTTMFAMMAQQQLSGWGTMSEGALIRSILADARLCNNTVVEEATTHSSRAAEQALEIVSGSPRNDTEPISLLSPEEVAAAKTRVQYQDGLVHIAITGIAGSGKSSLVNALRAVHNNHPSAARTGVAETTSTIGRYPDPNADRPFVLYDIPGAGTTAQTDWEYFINHCLFVFDCIIVLIDNRFTQTDIAILTNCKQFQIPTYIVRSKADIHIGNVINDMENPDDDSSDDDSNETSYQSLYVRAREQFIATTRSTVERGLRDANLTEQRVYMVSCKALLTTMKNKRLPPEMIDELELTKNLFEGDRSGRGVGV
ncbi:interferon-inducible GTPase-domain-containing protein, partial [Scleroderma citrinum]